MSDDNRAALIEMTAGIVANYVMANATKLEDLPSLISSVYGALSQIEAPVAEPVEVHPRLTAAQIRKSVSDAGIVSFLDGRTYQSLKRHLAAHGLTPEAYRERFDLPAAYPMVAPAYAARRSELAKAIGLGQGGRKPRAEAGTTTGAKARKPRSPKASAS